MNDWDLILFACESLIWIQYLIWLHVHTGLISQIKWQPWSLRQQPPLVLSASRAGTHTKIHWMFGHGCRQWTGAGSLWTRRGALRDGLRTDQIDDMIRDWEHTKLWSGFVHCGGIDCWKQWLVWLYISFIEKYWGTGMCRWREILKHWHVQMVPTFAGNGTGRLGLCLDAWKKKIWPRNQLADWCY